MRPQPIGAAGNGAIDDGNGRPSASSDTKLTSFPEVISFHKLGAILLRIAVEAPGFKPMTNDVDELGAGLHDFRR